MGSITKAISKVAKSVSKPVSKAFKSVAKGIAKVGKATLRGVSKLNKKFGPLGSIALAIAMPYALGGLSSMTTAAMNSQYTFIKAIGNVGNSIRTGYQAFNTGMSKTFSSITKSISDGFRKFSPQGVQDMYSSISKGAKNLFQSAKDTVKKYSPKLKTGEVGSVEVYGTGSGVASDPGIAIISSPDAAAAIQKGTLSASELGKQTLSQPTGWFTKANAIGVKSDSIVTDTINSAYKKRLEGFGNNAMRMFNDSVARAKELGTYVNDEQIGSYIQNNNATKQYTVADVLGDTDMQKTYSIKTDIDDLFETGDYTKAGEYTGAKTFASNKVDLKSAAKKSLVKVGESLLKPKTDYAKPYEISPTQDMTFETSLSGYQGTDITGTAGGDLFTKVFGLEQGNRLKSYYKNMNLLSSDYSYV